MAIHVINKINSRLRFLSCRNRFLNFPLHRLLCNAVIQPFFEYACNAWYPNIIAVFLLFWSFKVYSFEFNYLYVYFKIVSSLPCLEKLISFSEGTAMKIRLSWLFFVLSQPKLSVRFKILFSLFFKEAIVILPFMYCFWWNTPTYLPIIQKLKKLKIMYLILVDWLKRLIMMKNLKTIMAD